MRISRLDVETGYLHLDEIKRMAHEPQTSNCPVAGAYRVTFRSGLATVTFTVPEDMLADVIGLDALNIEMSKVLFYEDGDE